MFELLSLIVFGWLALKVIGLGLRVTWGLAKFAAAALFVLAFPALIGAPLTLADEGLTALMDGHTGLLYLEPTVELTERLRLKYERGGCPEYACL